jgi:hypothetical protein
MGRDLTGEGRGSVLAWAAVMALSCARPPPPGLPDDAGGLEAAVRARQERVVRVEGSARLAVRSPSVDGSLDALVAAERPDRLRLELLDFFGAPSAMLVAAGGRFGYLDVRGGTWSRGDATPENVSQLLPVALPAEELVAVLCGSAPLLPGKAVAARPGDGVMRLWIEGGGLTQRLDVGAEAAVEASRVTVRRPDGTAERAGYDLAFALFRHRAGIRFPGEVRLDAAADGSRVELRWGDDLAVNGEPKPGLFGLDPPPGARVVDLGPGAGLPRPALPLRRAE